MSSFVKLFDVDSDCGSARKWVIEISNRQLMNLGICNQFGYIAYDAVGIEFGVETYICKHISQLTWSFPMHKLKFVTGNVVHQEEVNIWTS